MTPNSLLLLVGLTAVSGTIVQPEWKIYYNLTTKKEFDIIDSNNPRFQYYKGKSTAKILRIGFGPIPCTCQHLTCGCCTGMNIRTFNFDRRACMNFTYDPYEFSLSLDMLMNENSLFAQSISGKNPPPACLPVVIPYGPPLDFCVRFFNIHTPGYNIFICMDFETKIVRAPLLTLHFDCMQMGVDGIYHFKPEDALTGPPVEEGGSQSPGEIEVYDEVYEEDGKNSTMESAKKPEKESKPKQETKDSEQKQETTDSKPKQETKKGEPKPQTNDSETNQQKPDCKTKQEKPDSEPKHETQDSIPKHEKPHSEQKQEKLDSKPEEKKPHSEQKKEKPNSEPKYEIQDSKPKGEKLDSKPEQEKPHSEPKQEKRHSEPNQKTPHSEQKQETPHSEPKQEKRQSEPKQEKRYSEPHQKTPHSEQKQEAPHSEQKQETPHSEPKQEKRQSEPKQEKPHTEQKQKTEHSEQKQDGSGK